MKPCCVCPFETWVVYEGVTISGGYGGVKSPTGDFPREGVDVEIDIVFWIDFLAAVFAENEGPVTVRVPQRFVSARGTVVGVYLGIHSVTSWVGCGGGWSNAPQKAGPESSTLSSTPHRVARCRGECSQRRHPLSLARLQCVVRSGPTVAGLRGVIPHVCAACDGPSRLRSLLSLSAIGACHVLRGEGDLCAFLVPVAAAVSPFVPLQAAPPGPGTTRGRGLRCCGPCGRGSERLRCRCRAKPGLRVAVVRIFDPRPVPLVRCLCNGGGECGYRRACCSHGAGGGGPGGWPSRPGGGSLLSRFPGPRPRRRELLAFGRSPAATRAKLHPGGVQFLVRLV